MSKEIELPSDLVDALNKYIDVWSKTYPILAPFPSLGFGVPPHPSDPYAVGLAPPPSGCHPFMAHGAGTKPAPSPALHLRKRDKIGLFCLKYKPFAKRSTRCTSPPSFTYCTSFVQ